MLLELAVGDAVDELLGGVQGPIDVVGFGECFFGDAAPGVYDGTPANPTEAASVDAANIYRSSGADGIVAIGGGSAMDLAKAVLRSLA